MYACVHTYPCWPDEEAFVKLKELLYRQFTEILLYLANHLGKQYSTQIISASGSLLHPIGHTQNKSAVSWASGM